MAPSRARPQRRNTSAWPTARESHIAAVLATAVAAHGKGQLELAQQGYTAILEQDPGNFDALHLLGVIAAQTGQPDVADTLIGLALQVRPDSHEAMGNRALALKALGRTDEAEAALRAALVRQPKFVDALRNLAEIRRTRGDPAEAIALLERGARAAPDHAIVRANLGALLLAGGDAGRAYDHLARAARLVPNDTQVLANLARAALETDRVEAGIAACERALLIDPANVPALVTAGALERVRGRFDVAEQHLRTALRTAPDDRGAQLNLATVLAEMARYDEAVALFDTLLAKDACDVEAHTSRAAIALACGRPAQAWPDHEWRWRLPATPAPYPPSAPEWNGERMGHGTLHVWPEQGIGDQITFASILPDLLMHTPHVRLGCDARLVRLFARSFPNAQVAGSECAITPSAGDRQIPIASLAAWLRPTLADFPVRRRYLVPDGERAAQWLAWLQSLGTGPRVGISWRSQNQSGERRLACTTLAQWAPVLAVPNAHFVCLQYDDCANELAAIRKSGATIHVPPKLDQRNDIDGVAALMSGLDLVITVATTVGTIAGAVGTPTWELGRGIDWHAMGRDTSPWQSAVRQVYRRWNATWDEVLAGVAADLRQRIEQGPPAQLGA
jgi:tetratricopeptide (TPR) repeat protein